MRLKWLSWAILGACIAAAVALFWPVRPLWMWLDTTPGTIQGYSQDGRWLYTVHIPEPGQLPYICQLNAATGELVKRILLEGLVRKGTPGVFEFDIRLSRDARTVFVGTQSAIGRDIDTWHLYDAQKGKRTSEAIMNVAHFNPEADSLNGRWFWTIHGIRGRSNHDDGVDIHSIETGKCILELRPNKDMHPRSIHFHPTNDQALVFWTNGKEHSYYQLIELPSGKEIKRFTLPTLLPGQRWRGIDSWEGDTLWSEYNEPHPEKPGDKGHYLRLTKRFDLRQEPLGEGIEEPLFTGEVRSTDGQTFWDHGENWVVYFRLYHPNEDLLPIPWVQAAREWIEKKLNLAQPFFGSKIKVRIVKRPTGQEQYVMPFPVGYPAAVSSDGRRLACGTKEGGVAVFNLDPMPRWLIVLMAGVGTGSLILLFGRWRKVRHAVHASQ